MCLIIIIIIVTINEAAKEKEIDVNVTEADFLEREGHEVEREIEDLKQYCDYIIHTGDDILMYLNGW